MLPNVPMTYTEDQAKFLAALREVAAELLLDGKPEGEWQLIDTRPASGPRGEARYASYTIQSRDFVKRGKYDHPVRILFRGSATGDRSSVRVSGYQLIRHPYYAAEIIDPNFSNIVNQYEE
jgi:hypothetical protein